MKRKCFGVTGIILSFVVAICLIAGLTVAFAAGTTVDNSVDKSTTRVIGVLKLTGCSGLSVPWDNITIYDSEKVKVAYSNPTNDYIQSLIDAAKEKAERLGQEVVDGYSGTCTLKPVVTEKDERSYDNRTYTWVNDNESDDGVLIGVSGGGAVGNQNKHMVIEGDYARTTTYTVTVEVVYPDHVRINGTDKKEPTCTEDGKCDSVICCSVCKAELSRESKTLDKLGHSFTNYISNNDARCTVDGTKTAKCDRCEATDTVTDVDSKLGHDYKATVTASTCTKDGYTTYTCSRCKDSYKSDTVKATGHKWDGGRVTTEPTYEKAGVKTFTCAVCKQTRTESVAKLEKSYTPGDVDGNGKIEASDARLALRTSVGLENIKEGSREFLACDVDFNGKVEAADARLILRASVGLEDPKAWKKS